MSAEQWAEKEFLAFEFLTWLWYAAEEDPEHKLEGGETVSVLLGERLVLGPPAGREGSRVTVAGRENSLTEARAALKRGKLVEVMRLGLECESMEFWMTLKAPELNPAAMRTPTVADDEGPQDMDARLLERVSLINTAHRLLEGLWGRFLTQRLGQSDQMAQALREWVAQN